MKQPKVTILTRAYNAEKYIAKAIESVLGQTEPDFEFIIRNNGSTDKTGEIIERYAELDGRIVYLKNKVNWVLDEGESSWWPALHGEYVTYLDADDYLDKRFIEITYNAAKKHKADMVVSGSVMINEENPNITSSRIPPDIATKNTEELGRHFIELYGTLRTVWGKLYKTDFYLKNYEFAHNCPIHGTSLDTYSVLGYLLKCTSFVSISQPLYYYLVRKNSSYRDQNVDILRIKEGEQLFNRGVECLKTLGIYSKDHIYFLCLVHMNHLKDLTSLVVKSKVMSLQDKVNYFQHVLNDEIFNSYSNSPTTREQNFDWFMGHMRSFEANDLEFIMVGKEEYLARLYLSYKEFQNNQVNVLTLPRLLSALCDSNNKYLFGDRLLINNWQGYAQSIHKAIREFAENMTDIATDVNKVREMFSPDDGKDVFIQKTEQIYSFISENKFEEALDLLNLVSYTNPLSKDCLLCRIYLSFMLGDTEFALDTCNVAQFFWNDSEDVMNLAQDVYSQISNQ